MEWGETLLLGMKRGLNAEHISPPPRVIEMAWEDSTPFEAIQAQFGLNQDGVFDGCVTNLNLLHLNCGAPAPMDKKPNI